jgi:hypothetical protein
MGYRHAERWQSYVTVLPPCIINIIYVPVNRMVINLLAGVGHHHELQSSNEPKNCGELPDYFGVRNCQITVGL